MSDHPKRIAAWRVWTDDGKCWNSTDYDFADLPKDGVIGMVVFFADGTRRVATGADYYFRADGNEDVIMGSDRMLPTPDRYRNLIVLKGRWTDDITMDRVVKVIHEIKRPDAP